MRLVGLISMLSLWLAGVAVPATIQYATASGVVVSASDRAIPTVPGYSTAAVTGAASAIQWPLPAGCSARDPEWVNLGVYRITNPAAVTAAGGGMGVNPSLGFYPTNSAFGIACRAVSSGQDVDTVLAQQVERIRNRRVRVFEHVDDYIVQVREQCPAAQSNTTCVESRTFADQIQAAILDRAQLSNYGARLAELVTQAEALKTAKGWTD